MPLMIFSKIYFSLLLVQQFFALMIMMKAASIYVDQYADLNIMYAPTDCGTLGSSNDDCLHKPHKKIRIMSMRSSCHPTSNFIK